MSSTTKRLINMEAAQNIYNKRRATGYITRNEVGKRFEFRVAGPGNDIIVKDRNGEVVRSIVNPDMPMEKRIFNVTAISAVAESNPTILAILSEAMAAEAAGDAVKADELFNAWLNKCSVSFNVILPLKAEMASLVAGDRVKGTVRLLTPEENGTKGELITLEDVSASPVVSISGGPKLSLAELTAKVRAFGTAAGPFNQPVIAAPAEATA